MRRTRAQNVRNQWLRHALLDANCTQRELAEMWGITPAAMNRWIMKGATLPIERAIILCHVLGWTLSDILKAMGLTEFASGNVPRIPEAGGGDVLDLLRMPDGRVRLIANFPIEPRRAAPLVEIIRLAKVAP